MAHFIKYSKLEHFNTKNNEPFNGKHVYISEKIHGANFQILINLDKDNEIKEYKYGRRTGFISTTENFFGHTNTMEKYKNNIINLAKNLGEGITIIYGEYFGGNLNGKKAEGSYCVQNSKYANYCEENKFAIFDIIHNKNNLCWDNVKELCLCNSLLHVPEINSGIFPEIIEGININTMKSIIAEGEQNLEGIVIGTPDNSINYKIKWVNEGLSEKPRIKPKESFEKNRKGKYNEYNEYMNQNRFDKYLSKVGPDMFNMKNLGIIIKDLVMDALEDIYSDNNIFSEKEEKQIKKDLSFCAKNLAISYMK